MGVYNTILVECPRCGELVEFQSKGGSCSTAEYRINDLPKEDLEDIKGQTQKCDCGYIVSIKEDDNVDGSHLVE